MPRLSTLSSRRACAAAALLGALAALALPPFHLLPVLLLSVPGLVVLIDATPGPRRAAWIGAWFGFGHHLVGLYWITEAILIESARYWWLVPFAVPALAAVLAAFFAAPCAAARMVPAGWRRVAMLCGAWVLSDLARQFALTGFPWNPWGSVWAIPPGPFGWLGDAALQPAAIVGVHGLTLLTLLVAATPLFGRRGAAAGIVVLALWIGFGAWRLALPEPPQAGLRVVLVQGNIEQGRKWDRTLVEEIFGRYLALTRQGMAAAGTKAVAVWPETASPYLLDQNARAAILDATGGQPALVGAIRLGEDRRPRNSLFAFAGNTVAVYDKWHLVPFGEYVPDWLPIPVEFTPGGFAPGPGPRTLQLPGVPPFGVMICYEAIFPAQGIDASDRPAWLVNVTNDAWFGNSTGPRQHLAAARMRAVESGLPLMRAANTGISAGFDARGRELGRLGLGRTGTLVLDLPGALPATPFARWGLPVPLALALGLVLIAWIKLSKRET